MHGDCLADASALGENMIASVGCDRIVVSWEYGIGKLTEKIKIGDYDYHQAVLMEAGRWGRMLRYEWRIRRAHTRKIQTI